MDTLKVPPKTKVEAMITTWAVTYESTTNTEITVDMTHVLATCMCTIGPWFHVSSGAYLLQLV